LRNGLYFPDTRQRLFLYLKKSTFQLFRIKFSLKKKYWQKNLFFILENFRIFSEGAIGSKKFNPETEE